MLVFEAQFHTGLLNRHKPWIFTKDHSPPSMEKVTVKQLLSKASVTLPGVQSTRDADHMPGCSINSGPECKPDPGTLKPPERPPTPGGGPRPGPLNPRPDVPTPPPSPR